MILPRFWWIGSSVCFSVVERGGGTNTPDIRIQPTKLLLTSNQWNKEAGL